MAFPVMSDIILVAIAVCDLRMIYVKTSAKYYHLNS